MTGVCVSACLPACLYVSVWCTHVCICVYMHIYLHICARVYMRTHSCICVCWCVYVCACVCVHANTLDQEPQIPTASGSSRVVKMEWDRWKLTLVLRIQGAIESSGNVANRKPVSSRKRKIQLSSPHLLPAAC